MDADADLTERERAVVDAFQGEGSPVVERSFEPADGRTLSPAECADATARMR